MTSSTEPEPTATSEIIDELRAAIVHGEIPLGTRLRAQSLADQYGVSRTPVREALVMLESEGLVQITPRRGAVVTTFNAADLWDLYSVRATIESFAAEQAAQHISDEALARLHEICAQSAELADASPGHISPLMAWNDELHSIVIQESHSRRAAAVLKTAGRVPVPFRAKFYTTQEQVIHSIFAHEELTRALASRSPERSGAIMRAHLLNARDFLVDVTSFSAQDDESGSASTTVGVESRPG